MIVYEPISDHYDVAVVGSGPAGITTALRIVEQSPSVRVAIIESGSLEHDDAIQSLSEVTSDGDMNNGHWGFHSRRIFGGTSSIWAGWCATMEKRAFELGEWPIEYADLDAYYPEASEILRVPADSYLYREAPVEGSSVLMYKPFYFSDTVRFGEEYKAVMESSTQIDLILNKTCARLVTDDKDVTGVILLNSLGSGADSFFLEADQVVLACGGVGNPRLLQLSEITQASPVGHYLMEHPHLNGVSQIYIDPQKIRSYFPEASGVAHALQLSDEECIEHDILSFSVSFHLDDVGNRPLLGEMRNLALSNVTIRAEMKPQHENQVALGNVVDALGQPRAHVSFRYNYDALAHKAWQRFVDGLLTSGLGRPSILPPDLSIGGGGHLIGTTRMGTSELDSVVDSNCKVHSVQNLYIAGSSVFAAGGVANPTYTIVALALRLGDHLSTKLNGGG